MLGAAQGQRTLFILGLSFLAPVVVGWLAVWRQGRRFLAEVRRPTHARALDPSPVTLDLLPAVSVPSLLVRDPSRPRVGVGVHVASLAAKERKSVRGREVYLRRGSIRPAPLLFEMSRPFGLATRTLEFNSSERITVLPALGRISSRFKGRLCGRVERESRRANRPGHGAEIRNLREYVPGDPSRHIHWPSSARRGTLIVRQWEDEDDPGTLVLGLGWEAEETRGRRQAFEVAVSLTATILHEVRRPVRLILPGEEPLNVPLGDRRALRRAERKLALVDLAGAGWPDMDAVTTGEHIGMRLLVYPGTAPAPVQTDLEVVSALEAVAASDFIPRGRNLS